MSYIQRTALSALLLFLSSARTAEDSGGRDCLYGFAVGTSNAPVSACAYEDPRHIGDEPRVRQTLEALQIPASAVIFRGCVGRYFNASEDMRTGTATGKYVVTYPSDLQSSIHAMVAPVIHELAHVAQMRRVQGLENLRRAYEPRRIELGADFVAGLIFAKVLKNADMKDFLLNLNLIGSYKTLDVSSHGTPEQRSGSFRRGVHCAPRQGGRFLPNVPACPSI